MIGDWLKQRDRRSDAVRGGGLLGEVDATASLLAIIAGALLAVLIYIGSRSLRNFDAALIGYATATVFLAFGVTYRYVVWVKSPPAARYLTRGWRAFLSWRNFRAFPTMVPRALLSNLALQNFIRERGVGRWAAHQALFWGVVGATLITFPLTFGWIHFRASPGTETGYDLYLFGIKTLVTFDALTWLGWLIFHGLDVTAVMVIPGCAYFLWRRFRDREAMTDQKLGHDLLPLVALLVISVTGLMLTFSSALLEGRYYDFLAILHMAVVVLTLVFIPFGKFFHVIQRPASIGVQVYKQTSLERDGAFECRR
ncbi:MAG: MFS transporter, partial [Actinomycetota bacterium]